MTEPTRTDLDDAALPNSRVLARRLAAEMVENNEIPNAEVIRKKIGEVTNGQMKPSALTIQDEIKKWYAEDFWPTYNAMVRLPKESGFPAEVGRIFKESFQSIVVQLQAAARAEFQSERAEFQYQIDEADKVVREMQQKVSEHELRAAEAQERYQAEAMAHSSTEGKLNAAVEQISDLNTKLHAAHEQQAGHEQQLNEVRTTERERADTQIQAAYTEARRNVLEIDMLRQRVKSHELTIAGHQGENRRLVLEHAKAVAAATALEAELKNARLAHTKEVERMTAALRAAQAGITQADRMKPTLRPAAKKTLSGSSAGRVRRTLHKPTRT